MLLLLLRKAKAEGLDGFEPLVLSIYRGNSRTRGLAGHVYEILQRGEGLERTHGLGEP